MKKQTKKLSIKVRDLKPVKDAKGGSRKRRRHPKGDPDNPILGHPRAPGRFQREP